MKLTYTTPEDSNATKTGTVIKSYKQSGRYLVKDDAPSACQPTTRFVCGPQIIQVIKEN